MLETEFGTKFGQWLEEHTPTHSENYEFKVTDGGTFNLKQWRKKQPHQPRSLKKARGDEGVYHKISDMSMDVKPFDAFFTRNTPSMLVIWFNKYQEFFIIPIEEIPPTDSISYRYCIEHFKPQTLLHKRCITPLDF